MREVSVGLMLTAVLLCGCGSSPKSKPRQTAMHRFLQLEKDLEQAKTSEQEVDALQEWNAWLLDNQYLRTEFMVRWENAVGDQIPAAEVDVWVRDNPDSELWMELTCISGSETHTIRHKLIDNENWYVAMLNE